MLDLKQIAMKQIYILAGLAAGILYAQNSPVTEVPGDTVVLKIDGKNLTAAEIRKMVETLPADFGRFYQQNPTNAIEQLYVLRYLATAAEKEKLDQESPIKEQLELARANALASAMLSHEHNYFQVPEETVKDYYAKNQAKFQQVKLRGILIAFKPEVPAKAGAAIEDVARAASEAALGRTQRSEADARKLADDLVKQLRAGADFGKLVEQFSEDPASKAKGGDMGVVSVSSGQPAELKRAAMALQPGAVSEPVKQLSGFYILQAGEQSTQGFTEVYEPILQELRQAHVNEWFAAVRARFTAEVESPQFFARPPQMPVPSVAPAPAK